MKSVLKFVLKNKIWFISGLSALATAACVTIIVVVATMPKMMNFNEANLVTVTTNNAGFISPSDIASDGTHLFVSDDTSNAVYKVNISTQQIVATYNSSKPVNSVVLIGNDVFALVGGLDGDIVKLNKDLAVQATKAVGHTPIDAVLANGRIYVANRFSNDVTVLKNDASLGYIATVVVAREPMALCAAGNKVFVANHLPDGKANASVVSAKVNIIDATNNSVSTVAMPAGTQNVKDIALSSDGNYIYITQLISRYTYPITQYDRGWVNCNGIGIVEVASGQLLTTISIDDLYQGAGNPYGLEVYHGNIIVAISGLNKIMVIDEVKMLERIQEVKEGTLVRSGKKLSLTDLPHEIGFLSFIKGDNNKKLIDIEPDSIGPRKLTVSNGVAYVCEYFSGSIGVYNIDPYNTAENKFADEQVLGQMNSFSLYQGGREKINDDAARFGEILWNDSSLAYQGWESCASCHPEARADGLNWDSTGDGMGNVKQTKSIIYSHRTPPSLVTGGTVDAEAGVKGSIFGMSYLEITQEELDAVDEYLRTIRPVPSPALNRDGTLTKSAERGKKLFEEYSCVECHSGPNFTDMEFHYSNSLKRENDTWETRKFDTPTLVEIWRTSPYFFNGSAKTLKEAVEFNMMYTKKAEKLKYKLPAQDVEDLTQYVMSIGDNNEPFGVEQVYFEKADGTQVLNKLFAGSTLKKLTIRAQNEYTGDKAYVKVSVHNKKGDMLQEGTITLLPSMYVKDKATITLYMQMPDTLPEGAYYKIQITKNTKFSTIATDYIIYSKEVTE